MPAVLNTLKQSRWLAWLLDNPLLVREIRRRMRGRLFTWSLIGYVMALGLVSCIIMWISYPAPTDNLPLRDLIGRVGQIGLTLFGAIRALEAFIALIIAPMLTAGLATQEKEKDTFDFLKVTTLDSRTFVVGCLLTTACFLILVFSCTLPVLGLTFIFGGISMMEIIGFNVALFLGAMAICALGIFISTNTKRSATMGWVSALIFVPVLIFGSRFTFYFIGGIFFGGGPMGRSGFSQPGIPWWTLFFAMALPALFALIFAIAASRRLYEPNNRLFTYKQFAGFFVVALGVIAGLFMYFEGISSDAVELFYTWFFMIGAVLLYFSVTIFSIGRAERGDEVWNLRLRRPLFQSYPEDLFFHAGLIVLWSVGFVMLGSAQPIAQFDYAATTLPIVLASLVFAYSLARCLTGYFELRNQAVRVHMLILLLFWVICPAIATVLESATSQPIKDVVMFLIGFSPLSVFAIWTGHKDPSYVYWPVITQLILAVLAYLPTLTASWKRRTTVSYQWIEAPVAPEPQAAVAAP